MIKVPSKVHYRDPRYDRISRAWDREYLGKEGSVLSPAQQANKVKVRTWIDKQNDLKVRPVKNIHKMRKTKS